MPRLWISQRRLNTGQGYVALSRVRRLSGVYLTGLNKRALEVHPEILEKDRDFRAASDAARAAFAAMSGNGDDKHAKSL